MGCVGVGHVGVGPGIHPRRDGAAFPNGRRMHGHI